MTKEIQLTQGYVTIVDDKWFDFLNQFNWSISRPKSNSNRLCAKRHRLKNENWCSSAKVFMHRHIMFLEGYNIQNKQIDHKNGDALDNRLNNLRIATHTENARNRRISKTNTSGYKGVCWDERRKKWRVYIRIDNNKRSFLGNFTDILSAVKAYDAAAIIYHKEFANTNFPKENYIYV